MQTSTKVAVGRLGQVACAVGTLLSRTPPNVRLVEADHVEDRDHEPRESRAGPDEDSPHLAPRKTETLAS